MATWMVHFRIADRLLDDLDVNAEQFVVGNIGPDCGEPNEDWSVYVPSPHVSHWKDTESMPGSINSEAFYDTYIRNNEEPKKVSFYLGYYVHLLTDILWKDRIYIPVREKYKENFQKDKNFKWTVKEDWYDQDHKFLKMNMDFRAFRIFDRVKEFPNVYIDRFSDTAIEKRIKYISDFYNADYGNLDREYLYLTEEQVNTFVDEAVEEIKKELGLKKLQKKY